jgi:hypothetical protein
MFLLLSSYLRRFSIIGVISATFICSVRSTGNEAGQWLNHDRNKQANDQPNESFEKIIPDHLAERSTCMIRKNIFKFMLLNAKSNFPTTKQTKEDPGRAQGKR